MEKRLALGAGRAGSAWLLGAPVRRTPRPWKQGPEREIRIGMRILARVLDDHSEVRTAAGW